MIITLDCINLVKKFEGCKLQAYKDQGGVWTIGFGSTRGVTEGLTITQVQAETLLLQSLNETAQDIKKCLGKRNLNSNQFGALVSLVYNIGISNFKMSMLKRCLDFGNIQGAAQEFLKWNKVNGQEVLGLTRRREAERELFLKREDPFTSPMLVK